MFPVSMIAEESWLLLVEIVTELVFGLLLAVRASVYVKDRPQLALRSVTV